MDKLKQKMLIDVLAEMKLRNEKHKKTANYKKSRSAGIIIGHGIYESWIRQLSLIIDTESE